VDGHVQAGNGLRRKLISYFVKGNQTKYSEIQQAISSGDIKLAHRLTHTLKSNAGQLGKTLLLEAAANVERHLKDGKNFVTPEEMAALETELNDALSQFAAELEANSATLDEPSTPATQQWLDAQSIRELIEKLEPMLEMGDPECRKLIDGISMIPGSEGGLITRLIQQIDDFDFEKAVVSLTELKKELKGKDMYRD
jgi:HPt (histidine-containing phosphotransfer) domain-containing protein